MLGLGILSGLLVVPLFGALFIAFFLKEDEAGARNARWVAIWTTLVVFLLSLFAWREFDIAKAGFQLVERREWLGEGIVYQLGVDGISMPFVLLTTFLMPFCILASWESISKRVREYMIAFLVLETMMIGVFVALD
ncbi:MAG: NADH-quinone oxidoreductase subunit M, partial [Beijerinckiaceae bacterium]